MKRQPKPFAVEIKRSRRSPIPLSPSPAGEPERGRHEPAEPAFLAKVSHPSPCDADLVVPAFLQQDKASRRPVSKPTSQESLWDVFKDKTQVFASASPQSAEPQPSSGCAPPRILQSLDRVEPEPQVKPERQVRRQKENMRVEAASSGEADTGSGRENAARRKPATATRLKPVKKRATTALKGPAAQQKSKPAEAVVAAPILLVDPAHEDPAPRSIRVRAFLKRGREDVAALPPGQRWKRRLHPSAR
jgi:hypothetical protein